MGTDAHLLDGRSSRRSFVGKGLALGAGAIGVGKLFAGGRPALAASGALSAGDAAILRFLAAAEIIETDLWQQYNELGGIQDDEVPAEAAMSAIRKRWACSMKT